MVLLICEVVVQKSELDRFVNVFLAVSRVCSTPALQRSGAWLNPCSKCPWLHPIGIALSPDIHDKPIGIALAPHVHATSVCKLTIKIPRRSTATHDLRTIHGALPTSVIHYCYMAAPVNIFHFCYSRWHLGIFCKWSGPFHYIHNCLNTFFAVLCWAIFLSSKHHTSTWSSSSLHHPSFNCDSSPWPINKQHRTIK